VLGEARDRFERNEASWREFVGEAKSTHPSNMVYVGIKSQAGPRSAEAVIELDFEPEEMSRGGRSPRNMRLRLRTQRSTRRSADRQTWWKQ